MLPIDKAFTIGEIREIHELREVALSELSTRTQDAASRTELLVYRDRYNAINAKSPFMKELHCRDVEWMNYNFHTERNLFEEIVYRIDKLINWIADLLGLWGKHIPSFIIEEWLIVNGFDTPNPERCEDPVEYDLDIILESDSDAYKRATDAYKRCDDFSERCDALLQDIQEERDRILREMHKKIWKKP